MAMMQACNGRGVEGHWRVPSKAEVDAWFNNLAETPVREEKGMIHPTKVDELEFIALREEEMKKATHSKAVVIDAEGEEHAEECEDKEEHAEEHGGKEEHAEDHVEEEEPLFLLLEQGLELQKSQPGRK